MPFYVIKGDLVSMNVDAIVNAANVGLKMVEGVGRAIFHKAGDLEMNKACKAIGGCKVGKAVETPAFNIKNAKIIIHAVGPNYINGKHGEEKNLISAYKESFKILKEHDYNSIAFPLLSGEFNYPQKEAFAVASNVILEHLKENKDDVVYLVMYKNIPNIISDKLQEELTKFIIYISKYNPENEVKDVATTDNNSKLVETIRKFQKETNTDDDGLILLGNLSHQEFNKLVSNPSYIPTKNVVLAFAIAMKLSYDETLVLLKSLGYSLTNANLLDLVVTYFIKNKIYDVYQINNALFVYDGNPLGADF